MKFSKRCPILLKSCKSIQGSRFDQRASPNRFLNSKTITQPQPKFYSFSHKGTHLSSIGVSLLSQARPKNSIMFHKKLVCDRQANRQTYGPTDIVTYGAATAAKNFMIASNLYLPRFKFCNLLLSYHISGLVSKLPWFL